MGMSAWYGPTDEEESIATIRRALELGIFFLDTADVYGFGKNEELVGRAIAGRREEVVLATKFGNVWHDDGSRGVSGRPEYVREAIDRAVGSVAADDPARARRPSDHRAPDRVLVLDARPRGQQRARAATTSCPFRERSGGRTSRRMRAQPTSS